MTGDIDGAICWAAAVHQKGKRKDGVTPYFVHCMDVLKLLCRWGITDEVTLQSGVLHDTIEDTAATKEDVRGIFGREVEKVVCELTHNEKVPKALYMASFAASSVESLAVKVADVICNTADTIVSEPECAITFLSKRMAVFEAANERKHEIADKFGVVVAQNMLSDCITMMQLLEAVNDEVNRVGNAR